MVGEVNKIIYNMLISGKGVFLPEVGTLYIERQGARKISENKLIGPRNVVNFTSQEQASSLVDEIVSIAGCSVEQAQDIYNRWLEKTRDGNTITIGGVGVLNHKSFSIESVFGAAINPKGVKTIVVRRKSHSWLYILVTVCVAVTLGFFAYIMWGDKLKEPARVVTTEQAVEVASNGEVNLQKEITSVDSEVTQIAEQHIEKVNVEQYAPKAEEKSATISIATHRDYYAYYVVMGVFSSEQNAERAVVQAREKLPNVVCAILPFREGKFMVTVYGSDSLEECNEFARSSREAFGDLWVYNKR